MPTYIYKAVDVKGKSVKGEMQAENEMELTTQLAKMGYMPVNIAFKTDKAAAKRGLFSATKKVDPQQLVIFTRQFATIIKAAVPIVEGLSVLSEQAEDPALKVALKQVVKDVEGGTSLSQALAKHPGVFHDLYVNTVIAGESAGVLDKVLMRLSIMLKDDQENTTNIMAAMRYPIMVVIALFIAVFILSVFVMPQFASIYKSSGMQLPLPTQIMMVISVVMKSYWFIFFPCIFGSVFLFRWFIDTKSGRWWWDGLKFKAPIMGKIYTKVTMLRFASMLNVLYQAGLPVLRTLDIVGITIGNVVLTREIESIKRDVADGKGISGAVLNSKFFPRLVGYMIAIGEKSGSLPIMLDSLCEYFDLEVKTAIQNITTMIEPIMTAFLGTTVMGMALAIFLPLWSMIELAKAK